MTSSAAPASTLRVTRWISPSLAATSITGTEPKYTGALAPHGASVSPTQESSGATSRPHPATSAAA